MTEDSTRAETPKPPPNSAGGEHAAPITGGAGYAGPRSSETGQAVSHPPPRIPAREIAAFFLLLVVAIVARAVLVLDPRLGHAPDIDLFIAWTRGLIEHGLGGFYEHQGFCDYPPLMLLILQGVGRTLPYAGGDLAFSEDLWRALKIPACLADLVIGVTLYVEARKRLGRGFALPAAALYLLNPISLYDSAYWGQVDSIYTALVLLALVLVGRKHWLAAGIFSALAIGAKFQSIAILPLVVFECYRLGGWRGLGFKGAGFAIGAAAILAPFQYHGVANEAIRRSYVNVVGQYHELSKSAYNLWSFAPDAKWADTSPPPALVRAAAAGAQQVAAGSSWLLSLRYRTLSLALFALAVAVVLALYSIRPNHHRRFASAGLLALAFYLFPTEMHERYAFPAFAFLSIWAVAARWRERLYFLLTVGVLLNIAAIQPIDPIATPLSGMNLLLFGVLLVGMCVATTPSTGDVAICADDAPAAPPRRALIPLFRWGTLLAVLGAAGTAAYIGRTALAASATNESPNEIFLSTLSPRIVSQGWGRLGVDRSVTGGTLQVDDMMYLRGLGTHAPARIVFDIPEGCEEFRAIAGIDAGAAGKGSAVVEVMLDGERAFRSDVLTGASKPIEIRVPLSGAKRITLICDTTNDGRRSDHVSWGLARFMRSAAAPNPGP